MLGLHLGEGTLLGGTTLYRCRLVSHGFVLLVGNTFSFSLGDLHLFNRYFGSLFLLFLFLDFLFFDFFFFDFFFDFFFLLISLFFHQLNFFFFNLWQWQFKVNLR